MLPNDSRCDILGGGCYPMTADVIFWGWVLPNDSRCDILGDECYPMTADVIFWGVGATQ